MVNCMIVQSRSTSVLVQLIAAIVFPIALLIFTIPYCLDGAVLYACGPLILALYPVFGVGQWAPARRF